MLTPCPSLHPSVERKLAALGDAGIEATVEEVVWLCDLHRRTMDPRAGYPQLPPGYAIDLCPNVKAWPLHALATTWWIEASEHLPEMQDALYVYAHTRSAPGDRSLLEMQDWEGVAEAIGQWRSTLPIHDELWPDYIRLMRQLDGDCPVVPRPDAEDGPSAHGLPGLYARLCSMVPGTTPEYWESGISEGHTAQAIAAMDPNAAQWNKTARFGRAQANYLNAVKWIIKRHSQEAGAANG
jgi:hypothetical protein